MDGKIQEWAEDQFQNSIVMQEQQCARRYIVRHGMGHLQG